VLAKGLITVSNSSFVSLSRSASCSVCSVKTFGMEALMNLGVSVAFSRCAASSNERTKSGSAPSLRANMTNFS